MVDEDRRNDRDPGEPGPPRDLSPEDLEQIAGLEPPEPDPEDQQPADADEAAVPGLPGEGELPRTLSGEPFPGDTEPEDEPEPPREDPDEPPEPAPFEAAWSRQAAGGSVTPLALEPHDPFEDDSAAARLAVTGTEELTPDPDRALALITQERVDALWEEINQTYNYVIADVRGYYHTTEQAIAELKRARELLLAGAEHFDNAEEAVKRVKSRLRLERKVRQWSRTRGVWLAVYLTLWLMVLTLATLLTSRVYDIALVLVPGWMAATFLPALYGGLGGVVGALWVLIKHMVRRRDFDPIHTPWYVLNPLMGMALGAITYFLLRASTLILGADVVSLGDPGEQFGLYFVSVVVGFNQNVLWALIDRVIGAVIPPEKPATTEAAALTELSQD
ncbi:MAG TPA: hypothetical protein VKY39_10070 [Aggregatilineales bacterium]|nr:hypothetical protein [Aggregatilineales bacterium]